MWSVGRRNVIKRDVVLDHQQILICYYLCDCMQNSLQIAGIFSINKAGLNDLDHPWEGEQGISNLNNVFFSKHMALSIKVFFYENIFPFYIAALLIYFKPQISTNALKEMADSVTFLKFYLIMVFIIIETFFPRR